MLCQHQQVPKEKHPNVNRPNTPTNTEEYLKQIQRGDSPSDDELSIAHMQ